MGMHPQACMCPTMHAPQACTSPGHAHLLGTHTPTPVHACAPHPACNPPGQILRDAVNELAVRILLECILVQMLLASHECVWFLSLFNIMSSRIYMSVQILTIKQECQKLFPIMLASFHLDLWRVTHQFTGGCGSLYRSIQSVY